VGGVQQTDFYLFILQSNVQFPDGFSMRHVSIARFFASLFPLYLPFPETTFPVSATQEKSFPRVEVQGGGRALPAFIFLCVSTLDPTSTLTVAPRLFARTFSPCETSACLARRSSLFDTQHKRAVLGPLGLGRLGLV